MKEEIMITNYYAPLMAVWFATVLSTLTNAQPAAQQPQEYTIKLTTAEIDIVGKALGTLPYQEVALIIQKLRQQIVDQQSKPDEKK